MAENLTLGQFLRAEREKKGITLEQIASATKVGVRLLHMLEADQFEEMPAKPFIRGFVTSYSRFIGLEPKEVLTRYNDFIDQRAHDRPNREGGHSGYAFEKREGEQSRTVLWIVLGSFIALGGLAFVLLKPSLHHKRKSHVEKLRDAHHEVKESRENPKVTPSPMVSSAPVVISVPIPSASPSHAPEQAPVAVAVAEPTPELSPSPNPVADPLNSGVDLKGSQIHFKALFKALANVWVRYQVDEKKVMKFILQKDRILVLRAQNSIRIQFSNPQSVAVSYRSRNYKKLTDDQNAVMRNNNVTLFYPSQLSKTIEDPFPGERPLPSTPGPKDDAPQASITPSP